MDIIRQLEQEQMKKELPDFRVGDTLKVHLLIKEGKKEKTQVFQGICIGFTGAGLNRSFTVRKISNGIGVEKIFPLHSPNISKIEIVKRGKVRRSKLYYLRERKGKSFRVKEKRQFGKSS